MGKDMILLENSEKIEDTEEYKATSRYLEEMRVAQCVLVSEDNE